MSARLDTRLRRGSIAVEFALTLSLLVGVALTVAQLGFFLSEEQRFVQSTFEATRYAAISPEDPSEADVRAHAEAVLTTMGLDPEGLELTVNWGNDGFDDIVTVTMRLPATVLHGTLTLPTVHEQQFTAVVKGS